MNRKEMEKRLLEDFRKATEEDPRDAIDTVVEAYSDGLQDMTEEELAKEFAIVMG